jgi:hypothetical protein
MANGIYKVTEEFEEKLTDYNGARRTYYRPTALG